MKRPELGMTRVLSLANPGKNQHWVGPEWPRWREGKGKLPRTGMAPCSRQESSEAPLYAEGGLAVVALAVAW